MGHRQAPPQLGHRRLDARLTTTGSDAEFEKRGKVHTHVASLSRILRSSAAKVLGIASARDVASRRPRARRRHGGGDERRRPNDSATLQEPKRRPGREPAFECDDAARLPQLATAAVRVGGFIGVRSRCRRRQERHLQLCDARQTVGRRHLDRAPQAQPRGAQTAGLRRFRPRWSVSRFGEPFDDFDCYHATEQSATDAASTGSTMSTKSFDDATSNDAPSSASQEDHHFMPSRAMLHRGEVNSAPPVQVTPLTVVSREQANREQQQQGGRTQRRFKEKNSIFVR